MTLSIVEQFGKIKEPILSEGANSMTEVIVNWVNERIEVAKEVLQVNDKNTATRSLSQSIALLPIISEDGKVRFQVEANDYWDFVNSGVNGTLNKSKAIPNADGITQSFKDKQPPKNSIREWMFNRSITTSQYTDKNGAKQIKPLITEADRDGLAYAIAKSVKLKGQEAVPFMNIAFSNEALEDLENRLIELWQ